MCILKPLYSVLSDVTSVDITVLPVVLYRSSDTIMDLQSAISDAILAMDLFFNNRFAESKTMYEKWYDDFLFW